MHKEANMCLKVTMCRTGSLRNIESMDEYKAPSNCRLKAKMF